MKPPFKKPGKTLSPFLNANKHLSLFIAMLVFVGLMAFMPNTNNTNKTAFDQGVVFEIETSDYTQSPPKTDTVKVLVGGENIKMDILSGKGASDGHMIFRGGKGKNGEIIFVDDDKKQYHIINDAFISQMSGKMKKSKSMIEEAMKGLPKEQLEKIKEAQKKSGGKIPGFPTANKPHSKPKVKNTGKQGLKNGYPCVKFEVDLDGKKTKEFWITDWSNIDGGDQANEAFTAMRNFLENMMANTNGYMPRTESNYSMIELADDLDGFPVVVKEFDDDGSLESESNLRSATRRDLDPDDFEPPVGYGPLRSMGPQ